MEALIKELLLKIGENPEREGLRDTPQRVARSFEFLTRGYHQTIEELVGDAVFESENDEMIIVRDIELYSLCEHHILPFFGKAHVGYIPRYKIIGLSKIPRIIDLFSSRLQIQERLTQQIATSINTLLNPQGVMVVIEARHLCGMMRGVEKQNSSMTTSACMGLFKTRLDSRSEFLSLINKS